MELPRPDLLRSKLDHVPNCPHYCCSDFLNISGRTNFPNWQRPNLSNPIHPILGRNKFPGLSDAEYTSLDLTLRLTSRMLADRRALHYIWTIVEGDIYRDHGKNDPPGRPLRSTAIAAEERAAGIPKGTMRLLRYPSNVSLDPGVQLEGFISIRGRILLNRIVNFVTSIRVVDLPGGAMGQTINPSEEIIPFYAYGPQWPSHYDHKPLRIEMDRKYFWRFREPGLDEYNVLFSHYSNAQTLVHEIGHVINILSLPRKAEAYYMNDCWNEAGFALEGALFGSRTTIHPLHTSYTEHSTWTAGTSDNMTISIQLPDKEIVDWYAKTYPEQQTQPRWDLREWQVHSRVPYMFIKKMFTEAFWTNEVSVMSGPIRPAQSISWIFRMGLPGDGYYSSTGEWVILTDGMYVACSINDPSLPPPVIQAVKSIFQSENLTRQALHAARAARDRARVTEGGLSQLNA